MSKLKQESTQSTASMRPSERDRLPLVDLSSSEQEERRRNLPMKLKYMRDRDRELIKGRFKYYDCPGGQMKFSFKQYHGDPIDKYCLNDGEIRTLPLGVIRHLNKNCFYTIHEYAVNDRGVSTQVIGKKIQRCEFVPMEFVDIEDISPSGTDIVTVQHML